MQLKWFMHTTELGSCSTVQDRSAAVGRRRDLFGMMSHPGFLLTAGLGSKASEYTEDAIAIGAVVGLAAAAYYGISILQKQKSKEVAEAEALLRQEQELASRSPVTRVKRLVQRLKGNA